MLKKFFLNILSSFVGAWIAFVLLAVGFILFVFGMIGSFTNKESASLKSHSILRLSLEGAIEETESNSGFDYTILMNGKIEQPQILKNLVAALEKASVNSDIDALFIECCGVSAAPATLNALRKAIINFKKSGKRVYAYGDNLTMGDYYVATVADELFLNPAGSLNLQGISGTTLYMKDLLDKVGIEMQTVRVGNFKSAIEPYTSNHMSEAAKLQLDSLYNDMWGYILEGISESRKVRATTVDSLVNRLIFLDEASTAKKYKLVDDCLYYREAAKILADYVGEDIEDLNFVKPETLLGPITENPESDNQIAVLYAAGEIGEFEGAGINCHSLVPIIVKLAEKDEVKGMVLRVNSPGGSVFGSEQIGEALDYFQSKGKKLAVSMGDYAASGGYWISARADKIYADPLTITGSIGIFGMVPNVSGLVGKLGLHPQTVSTNPGVVFPSIFYPMTSEQTAALQANVERGYEKFIQRVANGRHKSVDYIKNIAEGRVWSGMEGLKIGLVDELGNLNDAISWVKKSTKLEKANIVCYPLYEPSIWNIITSSTFSESQELKGIVERLKGESIDQKVIDWITLILNRNHLQATSPYYKISL